jgi:hypothetical protein
VGGIVVFIIIIEVFVLIIIFVFVFVVVVGGRRVDFFGCAAWEERGSARGGGDLWGDGFDVGLLVRGVG